jgi:ubiquinone/menaquinone biosynthesis C-methylase UbiE
MMNLNEYYTEYKEESRLSKDRAHKLESLSTINIMSSLINDESKVIELGAGTGVYIESFSKICGEYHATDIVEKHVEEMNKKYKIPNVTIKKADATALSEYPDAYFDVVLCLGPYYHLQNTELRNKCIAESKRICKKNGYIGVSYINKQFVNMLYMKYSIFFNKHEYSILEKNENMLLEYKDKFLGISYFNKPEEIESDLINYGLKIHDHVRTDGPYSLLSDKLEKMSEDEFNGLLDYHFSTFRDKDVLGMSCHGLVIAKKA